MNTRPSYPTDLTDPQWDLVAPVVSGVNGRGRPRQHDLREVVNSLLYQARTGCQWRLVPHDFPPWSVVRYYFDQWTHDGTLERLHTLLREKLRVAAGRPAQPSGGIVDSQSVKTANQPGGRGYDGGKKLTGRKRHLLVDTQGLLLAVLVTAANVSDAAGARQLLTGVARQFPRLAYLWADSSYRGLVDWVAACWNWALEIVAHLVPVHTWVVQKRRWVVERTFGWWTGYRRLSKDYEVKPTNSASWIIVSMCHLMLRRAAPEAKPRRRRKDKDCENIS